MEESGGTDRVEGANCPFPKFRAVPIVGVSPRPTATASGLPSPFTSAKVKPEPGLFKLLRAPALSVGTSKTPPSGGPKPPMPLFMKMLYVSLI